MLKNAVLQQIEKGGFYNVSKRIAFLIGVCVVIFSAALMVAAQEEGMPPLPDPHSDDPAERGEYLFRVQFLCIGCHLGPNPDGSMPEVIPLAYPSGGELFELGIANVYSANLTLLEDWSDDQIERAIRYGINEEDEPLLPIMGFSLYEGMTDQDMADVIAFLRSLEPIDNDVPEPEFFVAGMDREAFAFQGDIDIGSERPTPDFSDPLERGTYLANTSACMHCHGQVGEDFISVPSPEGHPWGWIAPPLMPFHLENIYESSEELRAVLTTGVRPNGTVLDETMPWQVLSLWPDEDIDALVTWIEAQPDLDQSENPGPPPVIETSGSSEEATEEAAEGD